MKKVEITYTVTGYYHEIIEVDDDTTIEEIEEMYYNDFPPIEEYFVEVHELETDDDDDDYNDEDEEKA